MKEIYRIKPNKPINSRVIKNLKKLLKKSYWKEVADTLEVTEIRHINS
jgi:hypothetical protein